MLSTVLVSALAVGSLIFDPGNPAGPLEPIYFEQEVVGTFHNETYSLTLNNLPAHTDVWVGFNLQTVGDWRGNSAGDVWTFNYDDNPTPPVLTSFSNVAGFDQAFPDRYPTGTRPAQYLAITGTAIPNESALYVNAGLYPHTADSLTLTFTGASDKEWILSNITVSMFPTPEPSSLVLSILAGLSLLAFGVRRRTG
jgi:hypothetical protein